MLAKDGVWTDVKPVPGTFVINLGDLMSRWTNDKWVSTMHRVVDPSVMRERQSVAFFNNINADYVVTAIPTCVNAENPSKYPPITAFDHLMEKHLASIKHINDEMLSEQA